MKGCTIVIAFRGGGREAGGRRPIRQDSLPCFQAAAHVAEQGCGWMSRLSAKFDTAGRCVVSGGIEAESCSPGSAQAQLQAPCPLDWVDLDLVRR